MTAGPVIERHDFPAPPELARALADRVAKDLGDGIGRRGQAALAVSGGSTPALFFSALARNASLEWDRVVVTLVDERWVDETSERSNARLVRQKLLQGPAAEAAFVPLYSGGEVPDGAQMEKTSARFLNEVPRPFDAVVLGMGTDGHTASFFPGADNLQDALSRQGPLVPITAPGAGEPRITLTLPALLETRALYLHIQGAEKAQVLETALAGNDVAQMPVRAVLRQEKIPLHVYWCP